MGGWVGVLGRVVLMLVVGTQFKLNTSFRSKTRRGRDAKSDVTCRLCVGVMNEFGRG